jgi:cyclic 2,3-diphosphoglycerate synthetase
MKVVALVDGEHYPSVIRWGLASARAAGYEVVAALSVGGLEKLHAGGRMDLGRTMVRSGGTDPAAALAAAIEELEPEAVLDLSDEPVLGYRERMGLIAVTLARGSAYIGPDFRFDPPIVEHPLPVPTLAVIGTGKRVAKTAMGGHAARLAAAEGFRPVVVAMGRGGPPAPVVAGPRDVTLEALMDRVDRGQHAASDYLEDALTAGVATVGARRCGGGMAGRPFVSNVAEAAAVAVDLGAGLVIMEGSGASVPTVPWDAGIIVIPDAVPAEYVSGYLGPLRVLLCDLAVLIIGGGSCPEPENLSTLVSRVRRLRADIRVAIAELQPVPLGDVKDKDVFLATTAPPEVVSRLVPHLEAAAGCTVVSVSTALSNREVLERDLASAPRFDVLLTELKAAAVDVAARRALERGAEVTFLDNRPVGIDGDGELDDLVRWALDLARERGGVRTSEPPAEPAIEADGQGERT